MRASILVTCSVSQCEMAGLERMLIHTSGGDCRGQCSGVCSMNSHGRCAGPSAGAQGPLPSSGTRVWKALRLPGLCQCSRSVGFSAGAAMKPSGPGVTVRKRSWAGRLSRMPAPMMPPGTSSAPTSMVSTVRPQHAS